MTHSDPQASSEPPRPQDGALPEGAASSEAAETTAHDAGQADAAAAAASETAEPGGYPRDRLDDVPYDAPRRGVYRGDRADRPEGIGGILAVVICGVLALLVGGVLFVNAPRLSAPDQVIAQQGSPSTSAAPEDAQATQPEEVALGIYNYNAPEGSATGIAEQLREQGWTVLEVSNWGGAAVERSTVLYAEGHQEQAEQVADQLDLEEVREDSGLDYGVVVVVTGQSTAEPSEGEPAASDPASEAPAEESAEG